MDSAWAQIGGWLASVGFTGDSAFAAVLGYWGVLKVAIIITAVLITISASTASTGGSARKSCGISAAARPSRPGWMLTPRS